MIEPIVRKTLDLRDGSLVRYSIYGRRNYGAQTKSLILGLHPGWGGELPIPNYGEQFLSSLFVPALGMTGAIIAAPDCPAPAWNHTKSGIVIRELIDHMREEFGIADEKITLVGYSAGGWGAWYFLRQYPERFCSVIMIATLPVIDPVDRFEDNFVQLENVLSARKEEWLGGIPEIPLYIIHSHDDELFPFESAVKTYKMLAEDQREVEFRAVEGVGHFQAAGYIEGLNTAVPWLRKVWSSR